MDKSKAVEVLERVVHEIVAYCEPSSEFRPDDVPAIYVMKWAEKIAEVLPSFLDADMYWLADDGEKQYHDVEDAVNDAVEWGAEPGHLIRLACAKSLPEITVRILAGSDYKVVEPAMNEREHELSPGCWCEPRQDEDEPSVWIHNKEGKK